MMRKKLELKNSMSNNRTAVKDNNVQKQVWKFLNRWKKLSDKHHDDTFSLSDLKVDGNANGIVNYRYEEDQGCFGVENRRRRHPSSSSSSLGKMNQHDDPNVAFVSRDNKACTDSDHGTRIAMINDYSVLTSMPNNRADSIENNGDLVWNHSLANVPMGSYQTEAVGNSTAKVPRSNRRNTECRKEQKIAPPSRKSSHPSEVASSDYMNKTKRKPKRGPPINPSVIVTRKPLELVMGPSQGEQISSAEHEDGCTESCVGLPVLCKSDVKLATNDAVPVTDIIEIEDKKMEHEVELPDRNTGELVDDSSQEKHRNGDYHGNETSELTPLSGLRSSGDLVRKAGNPEEEAGESTRSDIKDGGGGVAKSQDGEKENAHVRVGHVQQQTPENPHRQQQQRQRQQQQFQMKSVSSSGHHCTSLANKHQANTRRQRMSIQRTISHEDEVLSSTDTTSNSEMTSYERTAFHKSMADQQQQQNKRKIIDKRSNAFINFKPQKRGCSGGELCLGSTAYDIASAMKSQHTQQQQPVSKSTAQTPTRNNILQSNATATATSFGFASLVMPDLSHQQDPSKSSTTNTSYFNADGQSLMSHDGAKRGRHGNNALSATAWLYFAFVSVLWTSIIAFIDGTTTINVSNTGSSSRTIVATIKACRTNGFTTRLWCCLMGLIVVYFALEMLWGSRRLMTSLGSSLLVFVVLLFSNKRPLSCYFADDKQQLLAYLQASLNLLLACCLFVYWVRNFSFKKSKKAKEGGRRRTQLTLQQRNNQKL
eukprot:gene4787-5414_t